MKYVTSKAYDKYGQEFYYVHLENFPYIPVFGSIGDKRKADKIRKLYNQNKVEKKGGD